MTLWMVLIVVAVAWISGALFGWGSRELLSQHRRAAAERIWAKRKAAAEAEEASAAPASVAPIPEAAARSGRFWLLEEPNEADKAPLDSLQAQPEALKAAPPAGPSEAPAAKATEAAEVVRVEPSPSPQANTAKVVKPEPAATQTPTRAPAASETRERRPAAAAAAETAGLVVRTVASVQADPDNPPPKPRRRYVDPPRGSDYWRLLDKRNRRPPVTFWLEVGVLLMLLSAVSWAVIYFATQPVRSFMP